MKSIAAVAVLLLLAAASGSSFRLRGPSRSSSPAALASAPGSVAAAVARALASAQTSRPRPAMQAPAPPKPQFPATYTVSLNVTINTYSMGAGQLQFDKANEHMVINVTRTDEFSGLPITFIQWYNASHLYLDHNDNCKLNSQGAFYDFLGWVESPAAVYQGSSTAWGRPCNIWTLATPNANLTLCATDSAPVYYRINLPTYPQEQTMIFKDDLQPTVPPYVLPNSCTHPLVCPGGQPETVDVYIFHPPNTTDVIVNENVADLLGDVLFVCTDAASNGTSFDNYTYVSRYSLQVLSSWGVYQECNGYPGVCIGGDEVPVGREASFGVTANAGQCGNNTEYGSWFSLPADGQCQDPDQPMSIANNCTWRILERVKTIDGHCLLQTQGMLTSCLKEMKLPMTNTRNIFAKAFASNDPSQGGCPDVA